MTYEARKHAQKEADVETHNLVEEAEKTRGRKLEDATLMARELMRGDAAVFKAGYSFANAVGAACEMEGLVAIYSVALVAEKLHDRLVDELDEAR